MAFECDLFWFQENQLKRKSVEDVTAAGAKKAAKEKDETAATTKVVYVLTNSLFLISFLPEVVLHIGVVSANWASLCFFELRQPVHPLNGAILALILQVHVKPPLI